MIKSNKKLSPAKKSAITFGVLSAATAALGIAGLACTISPILSLVSGASLAVSALWGFLAIRAARAPKQAQRKAHKCECKDHKENFKKAKQRKGLEKQYIKQQVKSAIPGKSPKKFFQRIAETQRRYKAAGIPKSAKPYRLWKGLSVTIATISAAIALGSGIMLANNIVSAQTLASEDNTKTEQHLQTDKVVSNSLGVAIAGVGVVGLTIAAHSAKKASRKREDEMIENYHIR